MKAVLCGVAAGFGEAALCAIGFGVLGGDEAFNSWTIKASLGVSVSITAFFSVKAAQALANKDKIEGDDKNESDDKIDKTD